jgi:hypothetical protein
MNCLNPECNKPISDDKKYCNEDCLRKHLEIKKQSIQDNKRNLPKAIDSLPINNDNFMNDLKDGAFQSGIKWRKNKLEAIQKARHAGLTDRQILRELRISGITNHKAIELMTESEELLGR